MDTLYNEQRFPDPSQDKLWNDVNLIHIRSLTPGHPVPPGTAALTTGVHGQSVERAWQSGDQRITNSHQRRQVYVSPVHLHRATGVDQQSPGHWADKLSGVSPVIRT